MTAAANWKRPGAGNTEPLNSKTLGKASTDYHRSQYEESVSVVSFANRHRSLRRRAAHRLAQLYRLARFRRHYGLACDGHTFAFTLAATLACGKPGKVMFRGRINRPARLEARPTFIEWEGLNVSTLQEAVERADLGNFSKEELATIVECVRRYENEHGATWISAKRLGEMLQLTRVERDESEIWSADAVDEPKSARSKRKDQERKTRDRESKRAQRGRVPRPVYLAKAEERRRFCAEHGITDRTYLRWLKAGKVDVRSVSTSHIISTPGATHFGHVEHSEKKDTAPGPARLTGARHSVDAGGHSPRASPTADGSGRSSRAAAVEDQGGCLVAALASCRQPSRQPAILEHRYA